MTQKITPVQAWPMPVLTVLLQIEFTVIIEWPLALLVAPSTWKVDRESQPRSTVVLQHCYPRQSEGQPRNLFFEISLGIGFWLELGGLMQ
jgi:hypothetical protein